MSMLRNGYVQLWKMPATGGKAERLTEGSDRIRHMFYSSDAAGWLGQERRLFKSSIFAASSRAFHFAKRFSFLASL
ncbi:MAG: hypothetical protein DMG09_25460 [Acidobacteria bacterium]|nr:MAG: hypothetical protein DMG09_25460 [Acidobacteriota bacterium]